MTISKAYSFLERDEIVDRRPGRSLVVRSVANGELHDRRNDQIRQSLAGSVTVVRQLGATNEEAMRIFGEMLNESDGGKDAEESDA